MITFDNIVKKYKDQMIIKGVTLNIPQGKTVVFIGPSGSGKTTMLKMINMLIRPTSGRILLHDKDITGEDIIKLRRNIGYVIQQTGLFPHMTIKENIEIIPHLEKLPGEQINKRTEELMEMVGLDMNMLYRYPSQLSGGQQQRVGVARAFALDPEVILMDEPFSALDPITKSQLQDELINIQEQVRKTIIFVTHDMNEAIRIADLICILQNGEIIQFDTPENIMKNPANDFVEEFVGKNRMWQSPEYIKAEDVMTEALFIHPDTPLFRVQQIMRENRTEYMMVARRDHKFLGLATIRAILRHDNQQTPISAVMHAGDSVCLTRPDAPITDLLKIIQGHRFGIIPVLDKNNKVLGIITHSSLLMVLNKQFLEEDK